MKYWRKAVVSVSVATLLLAATITPSIAATDTVKFYYQGAGYTSKIGVPGSNYLPDRYSDLGISTAVITTAANYDYARNNGYERGRIWSRPNNVKPWLDDGLYYAGTPKTIRAVLQFQTAYNDTNLWISGSDPAETTEEKVEIWPWTYEVLGALGKGGVPIATLMSLIDGFVYASTKVTFPYNTRSVHYAEFYDWNGLPGMELSDAYTYQEAEAASANQKKGASVRWNFNLGNPEYTYYPVKVVGRLLYESYQMDEYGTTGYYNYGWTGLAESQHVINRR